MAADGDATTMKAVAVALVALSKCLIARDPALADQLSQVMQNASASGLPAADLDLLRMIVQLGKP